MTASPRQLVFDLAHRQALGAEDFLVSSSNAAAVEMIDRWPGGRTPLRSSPGRRAPARATLPTSGACARGAGIVAAGRP
ncbi:MAG: hypothetical protein WDN31_06630 [Hyphomicrobium sp.]